MGNSESRNIRICVLSSFIVLLIGCFISYGQSDNQINKIKQQSQSSKLSSFTKTLKGNFESQQESISRLAKANGWKISESFANGGYAELQDIGTDGTPIYYTTYSDYVNNVSRANALYQSGLLNLGIAGAGMKVGIWDGGVALTTHQEFDSRVSIGDETNTTNLHATMVTGTLIASGLKEKAKGVAYQAEAISHDWTRDRIEVAEAAANGLLLSNHSYGIQTNRVPDWYFGSYIQVSQDWDQIMYHAPFYLMVTAAGNSQRLGDNDAPSYGKNTDGFDLMLGFALSKNGITVAAADTKIDAKGRLTQATVTSYSSFGPVDDGRIKPDIAGAGASIYSTGSKGNLDYSTSIGTSMATPGITGSMLLLQQYYEKLNGNFMRAATLKGLVLHSADDVNEPGPDYKMGWGVMNTMAAANMITNKDYTCLIIEEEIHNGQTYEIKVNASGNTPLMASISWTDPASKYTNQGILNDETPALVNDLDIRISQDGITFYPWKLNAKNAAARANMGDNVVDPFEKIDITGASGEYIIRVSHKGNLSNSSQHFSLLISGIAVTECALLTPSSIELGQPTQNTINLTWEPLKDAIFEVQYAEANSETWVTEFTSDNHLVLQDLRNEVNYKLRIRTTCTENLSSAFSAENEFTFLGTETEPHSFLEYTALSYEENIRISIFPNPATEYIVVEGNTSISATYSILNTSGAVLKQGVVGDSGIYVNNLSSGLYILLLEDTEGPKSTKFYKS